MTTLLEMRGISKTFPGVRALDDVTREKLAALPSNDEVLAAAIRKSRVVLGQSGDGEQSDDATEAAPAG